MFLDKRVSDKAIIMTLVAFAGFSISDVLRKIVAEDYDIVDVLFWQAVCGLLILVIASPFMGGVRSFADFKNIKWHLVRGVLMALNTTFSLIVLSRIPITDAYTLFFLTPFVVSIFGFIMFKEAIGKHRLASIVIGFMGVLIAFRPDFMAINSAYLYAIGCVVLFSIVLLLSRHIGKDNGLLCFAFWPFVCLIIGIIIYKGGDIPIIYDVEFYVYMVACGAVYSLGLLLISYSYNIAPVAVVAPFQYVQIVFGIGFDYLLWSYIPDIYMVIGGIIIISAGIYLLSRERKLKYSNLS